MTLKEKNGESSNSFFPKIIKSDITLIHPGRDFQASLGSYGGGSDKTKNQIYNHIEITEENGKLFAKNSYGKNVFLPKNGIYGEGNNNIYFKNINGNHILVVEFSGKTEYYLENGDKYIPKTLDSKIIDNIKNIISGIIPYFK